MADALPGDRSAGLPDGSTLVLDGATVMLGTGGIGSWQVQRGNVAQAQGYPVLEGAGAAASADRLTLSGIVILNDGASEMRFALGGENWSLPPGGSQAFSSSQATIAYYTAPRGSLLKNSLSGGTYRFVNSGGQWALQSINELTATLDNRASSVPFRYIVQGEHQEVAAGQTQSHTSPYPLVAGAAGL